MTRTYLDAAAARTRRRAVFLAVAIILLPPAAFHLLGAGSGEPPARVRFDNEGAAEERKAAAWGLSQISLASTFLGLALWTAHRNRSLIRVEIDETGLRYRSMFREVHAPWDEVLGFDAINPMMLLGFRVGPVRFPATLLVRTRRGNFMLPPTLADASLPAPEVSYAAGEFSMRHADGRVEKVSDRDNPLVREIEARRPPPPEAG